MLNENLCQYKSFGTIEDIYYCVSSILVGVSSVDSMRAFNLTYRGQSTLNVDGVLALLINMGLIEGSLNDSFSYSLKLSSKDNSCIDSFSSWFSNSLLEFIKESGVLDISKIKYDSSLDTVIVFSNAIELRYAGLRNLLITFHLIKRREERSFIASDTFVSFFMTSGENLRRKKSEQDLLKELERNRVQGEEGELFVLNFEKKRLAGHHKLSSIKRISVFDVSAGYDILSFNDLNSCIYDRRIEVKTYQGREHFYWSANEVENAKLRTSEYYLYLVDYDKIYDENYCPLIINDPVNFLKDNDDWIIEPESFMVRKV